MTKADREVLEKAHTTCTLSAEHRVIDGAVAAQWMQAFKDRMENPLTILI
ncbi:2-oxo acid dehydrogenase subunit E2 [Paenarthrobacter ureafaciens]